MQSSFLHASTDRSKFLNLKSSGHSSAQRLRFLSFVHQQTFLQLPKYLVHHLIGGYSTSCQLCIPCIIHMPVCDMSRCVSMGSNPTIVPTCKAWEVFVIRRRTLFVEAWQRLGANDLPSKYHSDSITVSTYIVTYITGNYYSLASFYSMGSGWVPRGHSPWPSSYDRRVNCPILQIESPRRSYDFVSFYATCGPCVHQSAYFQEFHSCQIWSILCLKTGSYQFRHVSIYMHSNRGIDWTLFIYLISSLGDV